MASSVHWGRLMVAINEILLPEHAGERWGDDIGVSRRSRAHRRNARNRAPAIHTYGTRGDTDAYGSTLIFTGPGPDGTWFTDDDTQAAYGANGIVYCGYRYDAETANYYVRNRYYSPTLGRWLTRDPIGYRGGINLYGYVESEPVGMVDAEGLDSALGQYLYWQSRTETLVGLFAYYSGQSLALLRGIAAASVLKELQAERRYAGGHQGMSPLQYLNHLMNQFKKAEKLLGCHPPGDPIIKKINKTLKTAEQIAKDIQGGVALNSGNGPQRIAALGNIMGQLASDLPPGAKQLVGFYADALSAVANAVGKLDKAMSEGAWTELTGPPYYFATSGNSDTPFTPSWANDVLNQFGDVVPGFRAALHGFVGSLTR